jgi:hypothetical protein
MHRIPLSSEGLNNGDVFVLDNVGKIYVWHGTESNRLVRETMQERCLGKCCAVNPLCCAPHTLVYFGT